MEKKFSKELWEKAKAEGKVKRLEKSADAEKLSDADMAKVAGGFLDQNRSHGSWLEEIRCPKCSQSRPDKLTVTDNSSDETWYHCKSCGCDFMVDYEGFTCSVEDLLTLGILFGSLM